MDTSRRRLSSRQTFFVKYVWIGMLHASFATLTVLAVLESLPFDGAAEDGFFKLAEDGFFKLAVPFVWLVMVGGAHWTLGRLKQVEIDDEMLYVSNYLVEDAIGLAEIEKVTQRRGLNVEPVYVTFSRETDFGTRILFAPPGFSTGASGASTLWWMNCVALPNKRECSPAPKVSLFLLRAVVPSRLRDCGRAKRIATGVLVTRNS